MAEEKTIVRSKRRDAKGGRIGAILLLVVIIAGIVYFTQKDKKSEVVQDTSETSATTQEAAKAALAKIGTGEIDADWSYVTGYIVGQQILGNIAQSGDAAVLDAAEISKAINDVLLGKNPRIADEVAQKMLDDRIAAEQAAAEKLAAENKTAGDAYVATYSAQDGVEKTEAGTLYKVLSEGDGEEAVGDDVALVLYTGKKIDGTVFDSTADNDNEPVPFLAAQLIPGIADALKLMKNGDKWEIVVPVELGYGAQVPQGGPIGINEALVFEIEVTDIKSVEEMQAQAQAQQAVAPSGQEVQ